MNKEEIQAQIEVLKTELGKLEELAKQPKKFEFNFSRGNTYHLNTNSVANSFNGDNKVSIYHGRYRLTQNGARLSLVRNRKANRLEMLAEYLGGLKEFKFGEENWYVEYNSYIAQWDVERNVSVYAPERVYMALEVAKEVARLLNSGEYEL